MRFLARGSGRNAAAAAQAVEPKSAACLRCPRSWTAAEALRDHVIDLVAADLPALLARSRRSHHRAQAPPAHARGRERRPPRAAAAAAGARRPARPESDHDPVPRRHPRHRRRSSRIRGSCCPGLLGGVSLILALLGLAIVPFSWAGIALFAFGIVLLVLEGHVPAHGAFAAVGTLSLLLGAVILFRVDGSPYGTTSFWLALAMAGLSRADLALLPDAHLAGAAPARARRRVARGAAGDGRDGSAPGRPGADQRRALAGQDRERRRRGRRARARDGDSAASCSTSSARRPIRTTQA